MSTHFTSSMLENSLRILKRTRVMSQAIGSVLEHPLHRGRRLSSLTRWLGLKLAARLTPTGEITIPYVGGASLTGHTLAGSVGLCGRYGLSEYADMAFCLHLLRSTDLFCDVGANAGVYTVLAARAVGSAVVAMEPVPRTFDVLMQNIYLNGVSERVEAKRVGVGSKPGKLHFTTSLQGYNHVVEEEGADTVEADVLPLDILLGGRTPRMIKIDVEGFEAEVLVGAKTTLCAPELQAVLLEMWQPHAERYRSRLEDLLRILKDSGLSGPYWYDPAERKLVQAKASDQKRYKVNQLFIRDLAFVQGRLATSQIYEVNGAYV